MLVEIFLIFLIFVSGCVLTHAKEKTDFRTLVEIFLIFAFVSGSFLTLHAQNPPMGMKGKEKTGISFTHLISSHNWKGKGVGNEVSDKSWPNRHPPRVEAVVPRGVQILQLAVAPERLVQLLLKGRHVAMGKNPIVPPNIRFNPH